MLAQLRLGGDGINELMAGVLGVAGHKADVVIAGHGAQQVEQVGEIDLLLQPLTVAVHVLPQQGDLLIARFHKVAELGKDIAGLAALLAAADVGHDAVGAEVVAAVLDLDICPCVSHRDMAAHLLVLSLSGYIHEVFHGFMIFTRGIFSIVSHINIIINYFCDTFLLIVAYYYIYSFILLENLSG